MKRHNWPIETARYVRNLLAVYDLATEADIKAGKLWYSDARTFASKLARKHGVSLEITAGVIAALSPGTEWTRNQRTADAFLRAYRDCDLCARDRYDLTTYGSRPIAKAYAIADLGTHGTPDPGTIEHVLHGAKTVAFYRSIIDPDQTENVVIDGHGKSAALGVRVGNHDGYLDTGGKSARPGIGVQRFEYAHLERAFLTAARKVGLLPAQFQAIVWLVWKRQSTGFTIQPIKALRKAA